VGSRGYDGGGTFDRTFRGAVRPSFFSYRARAAHVPLDSKDKILGFGVWRGARVRGNSVARGLQNRRVGSPSKILFLKSNSKCVLYFRRQ